MESLVGIVGCGNSGMLEWVLPPGIIEVAKAVGKKSKHK